MATKQGKATHLSTSPPPLLLLEPGSGMGKKQDSGINIPNPPTLLFYLFCPRFQAHFHEMHSQKGIRDLLTKGRLRARKKPPKETIVDLG
jgi:hypothetical protein